jgi:hypothetical protein
MTDWEQRPLSSDGDGGTMRARRIAAYLTRHRVELEQRYGVGVALRVELDDDLNPRVLGVVPARPGTTAHYRAELHRRSPLSTLRRALARRTPR